MQPAIYPALPQDDPASRLAASARGWHSIQLAVLGFIGLCGVLQTGADAPGPGWVESLATVLSVSSLAVAGLATYLVGRVAYPLYTGPALAGPQQVEAASRQLRSGIRVTFAAVGLLAVGGASGWWPAESGATGGEALVEVRSGDGGRLCGQLLDGGPADVVRISTDEGAVLIRLSSIASIRPVGTC